jgi:hypothetical protein
MAFFVSRHVTVLVLLQCVVLFMHNLFGFPLRDESSTRPVRRMFDATLLSAAIDFCN